MAYEDSQPNELRLQPKESAEIPLIQPSNPQRKRRISSDSALDVRVQPYATSTSGWYPPHYTSEDARIHNVNNFKRRRLLKPGSTDVSCNNNSAKNGRPTHEKVTGTSSYRPSPPPAPLSDTLNKTIHVQKPNPTKPPPLPQSDVHSSSTQPLKCEFCKKAAKKKKKKKKKPPLLERTTNLPSNCLKSVFNRKKYQHRLLSEVRQRLQDELDATIVCFQFTETQLIVKYRDKRKNPTTSPAQSKNDENSGLSSGSNVKPEVFNQIIAQPVQLNKHKEESVLIPRQITSYPRPFRSGRILLDYSTPAQEFNQVNTVCEGDDICSRGNAVNGGLPLFHLAPASGNDGIRTVDHSTTSFNCSYTGDVNQVNSVAVTIVNEELENLTQLLRANNDKPRRLFVSRTLNRTYSISMHGYVQEIRKHSKPYTYYNTQLLYSPPPQVNEAVEDACLFEPPFDDLAIISRAHEDNSLTLLELRNNSVQEFTFS
ncbi:hypothetical protein PNOK_0336200 [Pyrrhoderma noxium]|uniref:Uncharacterized protein n=1 Tax=Pyrrhoderma noxium TaxID=2282107 RepID=A0A286UMR0_9AGAM|nr:hypothetical protein PNOK_0336200 [Pyrrhoderma noxium]